MVRGIFLVIEDLCAHGLGGDVSYGIVGVAYRQAGRQPRSGFTSGVTANLHTPRILLWPRRESRLPSPGQGALVLFDGALCVAFCLFLIHVVSRVPERGPPGRASKKPSRLRARAKKKR